MTQREIVFDTSKGRARALFGGFSEILSEIDGSKIALVDKNVLSALESSKNLFKKISSFDFCEASKTLSLVNEISQSLISYEVSKSDLLVACGGGVTTDVVGFVASVFQRGVPCVLIPTTLLAQVDAALGGKTGVNVGEIKNALGTFSQPQLTVIDVSFLKTLNEREFNSGMAEVIKHGVIAERGLLDFVVHNESRIKAREIEALEEIVYRSLVVKAAIVEQDEFDTKARHVLNFGHTLGHALEIECGLLHGEAVSIGMILEIEFAKSFRNITDIDEIRSILELFNLPTKLEKIPLNTFDKISNDKKRISHEVSMPIFSAIGSVHVENISLERLSTWARSKII